ncbi:MAG: septum site-determining protein MinD [Candidatus Limiplasma sp.]|nr:septum site-determining protein MinD [Candidatus Limiplasma sp.]
MSQVWMIASGKGGVGKSLITSALAMSLAKRRMQTVAVDSDIGLRNLDLMLGMESKVIYDVVDVMQKDCKLRYALVRDPSLPFLSLLPAAQMSHASDLKPEDWEQVIRRLRKHFSYILIDAPAGVDQGMRNVLHCADQTLLVTTPDDIAMRDAERLISLLRQEEKPSPMLVVNRIRADMVRSGHMYSPETVAGVLDVPLLGYVPEDPEILRSLSRHQSFMEAKCPAREAMERIARRFLGEYVTMPQPKARRQLFGLSG